MKSSRQLKKIIFNNKISIKILFTLFLILVVSPSMCFATNEAHLSDLDYALLLASFKGDKSVVEKLIEDGANVNTRSNNTYDTAMILAAGKGHKEIVNLLLQKGGDPDITNRHNVSAQSIAFYNNELEVVMLLLEHKGYDYQYTKEKVRLAHQMRKSARAANVIATLYYMIYNTIHDYLIWGDDRFNKSANSLKSSSQNTNTENTNTDKTLKHTVQPVAYYKKPLPAIYNCRCVEEDVVFNDQRGIVKVIASSTTEAKNNTMAFCVNKRGAYEDDMVVESCTKL